MQFFSFSQHEELALSWGRFQPIFRVNDGQKSRNLIGHIAFGDAALRIELVAELESPPGFLRGLTSFVSRTSGERDKRLKIGLLLSAEGLMALVYFKSLQNIYL